MIDWLGWLGATCTACGVRLPVGASAPWCGGCAPAAIARPPIGTVDCANLRLVSAFVYGGAVAAAIGRAKAGELPAISVWTQDLAMAWKMLAPPQGATIVAIAPQAERLATRGFHLPDLLAARLEAPCFPVRLALRRTDRQPMRRADRREVPVFVAQPGHNRHAVLVDDVVTTGKTLAAAATVLREQGWIVQHAISLADARPAAVAWGLAQG